MIATANAGGVTPAVSDVVASVSNIYKKNGVKLEYNRYSELSETEQLTAELLVTSTTAVNENKIMLYKYEEKRCENCASFRMVCIL